jgi:hypothetical protein
MSPAVGNGRVRHKKAAVSSLHNRWQSEARKHILDHKDAQLSDG